MTLKWFSTVFLLIMASVSYYDTRIEAARVYMAATFVCLCIIGATSR